MEDKDLKHVLVVDDEPDLINILKVILSKTKRYRVSGADEGKEALKLLSRDPSVDLVLVDMKMPGMDGSVLLQKIKENNLRRPKVLFITGFTDLAMDDLYDAGACGFIAKPFDWERIIKDVDDALLPSPRYNKTFRPEEIKAKIEIELESLDAAQVYSEDFTLGTDGFFIVSPKQVVLGNLISFKISFLGGERKKLDGVGQVIWYKRAENDLNHFGIKFYNIEPELEAFVEKFCNKNKIKAFIPRG